MPSHIGIDLGTSNSAVAWADQAEAIRVFAMPQFFGSGDVRPDPLLPSVLYYPTEHEVAAGPLGLPWDRECPYVVGHLARKLGSRIPGRLIHSAKSWLCHPAVDRRAAILPWAAAEGVTHLSPVEVSASYLLYMKEAWDHAHPGDRMAEHEIILTVPASFDAIARELTLEAARLAELPHVTLLEEPQAAFYSWLAAHGGRWREALGGARTLLVCDVGGGTTDFTLVVVSARAGEVRPERVAVGDHLLLGGDNMDLALAHLMEIKLTGGPERLEPEEWGELVHLCRMAKEDLLTSGASDSVRMSILGRGSGVVGGTRMSSLSRPELEKTVLDGFFPLCERSASPVVQSPHGLKEWGLPYAADAAVTRHLAQFLRDAAPAARSALAGELELPQGEPVRPEGILFNGGVFAAASLRNRVLSALESWFPGTAPRVLVNEDLGLAVARGAAYFAFARRGEGVRIGGGAARSYYIGLGSAAGSESDVSAAVCVVPRGMEEGETLELAGRKFRLSVGQVVRFPIYASSQRPQDRTGDLLDATHEGLAALPALKTALETQPGSGSAGEAAVELASTLTPMGTLELEAHTPDGSRRWRLEFDLRPAGVTGALSTASGAIVTPEQLETARGMSRAVFGGGRGFPKDPEGLRKRLEEALGVPRVEWDTRLLRELWRALDELEGGRGRSKAHETAWLWLAGWCLRPGFGDPLDPGRMDRLWSLAGSAPRFGREEPNHRAFWVMWRRVAPGLDAARQDTLYRKLRASLLLGDKKSLEMQGAAAAPGVVAEMWRLAASLERLTPDQKVEMGERMLDLLASERPPDHGFWAMARLAGRQPLTGAVRQVVGREVVQRWVPRLVRLVRAHGERASFAVANAARKTGDRNRDLSEGQRREVLARMEQSKVPPRHVQMIAEVVQLGAAEQGALLGDSVPPGLSLAE